MNENKSDQILGLILMGAFIVVKLTFLSVGYNLLLLPLGFPELSMPHLLGIFLFIIHLTNNNVKENDEEERDVVRENDILKKYIKFHSALILILFILSLFI